MLLHYNGQGFISPLVLWILEVKSWKTAQQHLADYIYKILLEKNGNMSISHLFYLKYFNIYYYYLNFLAKHTAEQALKMYSINAHMLLNFGISCLSAAGKRWSINCRLFLSSCVFQLFFFNLTSPASAKWGGTADYMEASFTATPVHVKTCTNRVAYRVWFHKKLEDYDFSNSCII